MDFMVEGFAVGVAEVYYRYTLLHTCTNVQIHLHPPIHRFVYVYTCECRKKYKHIYAPMRLSINLCIIAFHVRLLMGLLQVCKLR